MKENKQIIFEHQGNDYTLEFTRKTIATMERQGFIADDLTTKPVTTLPTLFAGAFLAHHRFVRREEIEKMYDKFEDKEQLLTKLMEMYAEPVQALFEEPEENEGNIKWEASW